MRDSTEEVRRTLVDPERVCRGLGLLRGARKQPGGVHVRCPWHADHEPSCSITRGPDGTLRAKCFACGATGDAFGLVAARYGLDCRSDFPEVLLLAAELGGLHELAAELRGERPRAERELPPMPAPEPTREHPDPAEVADLWSSCLTISAEGECGVLLARRGLSPGRELARAARDTPQPWARFQGQTWASAGYRLILPLYDPNGAMASVRAWRVTEGDGPKRLPPAGRLSAGLCLASPNALRMSGVVSLLVAEGEPDYLTLCQRYPGVPVIGVLSGAWTQAWADSVPFGSEVTLHTHHDDAGDRYAAQITATLKGRAIVRRSEP